MKTITIRIAADVLGNDHSLTPLLQGAECNECPDAYLEKAGKPLIIHNIDVANRALKGKLTDIAISQKFKSAIEIIKGQYRSVDVIELDDYESSKRLDLSKTIVVLLMCQVVHFNYLLIQ